MQVGKAELSPAGPRILDDVQNLSTDAYPFALDQHQLAAWAVFHTMRCWEHSEPGADRARLADRLDELSRRTPHLTLAAQR